jgi:chromosome partitioning protein
MNVLTVCSHKGGTGKTTTVIHLAAALGLSGRCVLAVDLDPQGFLTRAMNVEEPPADQSVAALFGPSGGLGQVRVREVGGFDLVPASSTLTRRMRDLTEPTDVLWVREALAEADPGYDVVLFDTAAAVTVYSLNALVASQHALIPVLPEYQSVVGGEQTYQTARLVEEKLNPQLEGPMFLLTQVDGRKRVHQTYREYVREKYRGAVLESVIRTSAPLARVQEEGETVFDHEPGARGARDYASAAEEVIGRIQKDDDADSSPEANSRENPQLSQIVDPG